MYTSDFSKYKNDMGEERIDRMKTYAKEKMHQINSQCDALEQRKTAKKCISRKQDFFVVIKIQRNFLESIRTQKNI